jgi:bacillopeptidase F
VSTTLSWGAVTGATSYDVYLSTASSPAFYQNSTSTSLAVSGLANSATYYWRVVAKNACGSGPTSVTRSFTTVAGGGGPVTILTQNGEGGMAGWVFAANTGSGWSLQNSTSSHGGAYQFRTNAAFTTYVASADWTATSPTFSLSGRTSATLTYYFKHSTESGYDYFWVEVSTNGGTSWTTLSKVSGASSGYSGWAPQGSLSLTPYVGGTNVKIRFRLTSDTTVQDWGAAVDDIVVTAQ